MKKDAFLNGQDLLNCLITPSTMQFTERGNPILKPVYEAPDKDLQSIPFNYVPGNTTDFNKIVHFFIQDYLFNRVWNNPSKYMEMLKKYPFVIAPDFSLFRDTPYPIQKFNHYRRQWCGAYWQENGINVIPDIRWSDESSYDWCFDGVPKNSVIAISGVGCVKEPKARQLFFKGYKKAIEVLEPKLVLLRVAKQYQTELVNLAPTQILEYDFYGC